MTSNYILNLNPNNSSPVKTGYTFKNGDKGITFTTTITELDTSGTTAKIVFHRSNGTSVEATLSGTGPTYTYITLGNEFAVPGIVVADIKLYNSTTQRVSTASFVFNVISDTMDGVGGGTAGYSDELETLSQELTELSQEFEDTLQEYKDAFGEILPVNPRGEWNSTTPYEILDLVSHNGNSYVCREDNTGVEPPNPAKWQTFASGYMAGNPNTVTGNPLSFTTDSAQVASNASIAFEPIQAGSGDPSPSNPRAISGYNEVNLASSGKNFFDMSTLAKGNVTLANGVLTGTASDFNSAFGTTNPIPIRSDKRVTFSCKAKCDGDLTSTGLRMRFHYTDGTYETLSFPNNTSEYTSFSVTTSNSKILKEFMITYAAGGSIIWNLKEIQIEVGTSATAYEPYNPATDIQIQLGKTIYGGTLDVESGVLTVTQERKDMGDYTWVQGNAGQSNQYFRTDVTGEVKEPSTIISEIYKSASDQSNNTIYVGISGSYTRIYVYDNATYVNAAAFKTAVTGHYVVYELATPYTIQLPPHVVTLLQGVKTVATNGISITLTYRDGNVATLNDLTSIGEAVNGLGDMLDNPIDNICSVKATGTTNNSGAQINSGTYFYLDGVFCKALSNIASGATFTLNTNYKRTTIAEELLALA